MAKNEPAREKPEAAKPKVETETKAAEKECFFITPIGEPSSAERRECDGLLNAVLKPVFEAAGFARVIVAHEINSEGSITQQVLEHVLSADVVVANLTYLNANVMYELAVRHCTYKPTICIRRDGTKLPFDLTDHRVISFQNDFAGLIQLRDNLVSRLEGIESERLADNPVTRAKRAFPESRLLEELSPKDFDVRNELSDIRELLRVLSERVAKPSSVVLAPRREREVLPGFRFASVDDDELNKRLRELSPEVVREFVGRQPRFWPEPSDDSGAKTSQ